MSEVTVKGIMPVLALRGLVVFPEQTIHFDSSSALAYPVGKKKCVLLLKQHFHMLIHL